MEICLRSLVNRALHVKNSFWILHYNCVRWKMCQIKKKHNLSTNKTGAINYCNYIHLLFSFLMRPFCMNTSITWHSLVSFLITQNITCNNITNLIMYIGKYETNLRNRNARHVNTREEEGTAANDVKGTWAFIWVALTES